MSGLGHHRVGPAGKLLRSWRPPDTDADSGAAGDGGVAEEVVAGAGEGAAGEAAAAAGDSLTAAAWTMVSRVTGVVRIVVIGAVLGPTFFGNTYQFTNFLPNLVYYGFLAGSLLSSLLVPALVRHLDAGDRRAAEHVAGGFLGLTLAALVVVAPLAVALGPLVLRLATLGSGPHVSGAAQVHLARLLIIMFLPQVFCYAVVATSIAVMNSRKQFALPAGAPAIENLGTIAVLGITAGLYGTGSQLGSVPVGEILLLGLGSSAAVALHAAVQWQGARRAGVVLLPRTGWREPDVLDVVRRALPALGQASLYGLWLLAVLAAANRLSGGVLAFQLALNFYLLAGAIGAVPVALSLLPRLSRMHLDGDTTAFRDTLIRGWALGFFVTVPAAAAYLVLAVPLARALTFGRMGTAEGITMVAVSLATLSVAVIGQTAFLIATYASYARKDTRSPLLSMAVQTVTCLVLVSTVLLVHGTAVVLILGLAVSASVCAAAFHLTARMWRHLGRRGARRLTPSLIRFVAGAAVMAGPAWVCAELIPRWLGPPFGTRLAIIVAALVGVVVYVRLQAWWKTEELGWLTEGFSLLRGKARRVVTAAGLGSARVLQGLHDRVGGIQPWNYPGRWDDSRFRRTSSRWILWPALVVAAVAGAASTLGPEKAMLGLLVLLLLAAVWRWPALAAYLVVVVTPLTVGISRGASLPLRPNEVVDALVGVGLAAGGLTRLRSGRIPRLRLDGVEWSILLLAVFSSVVPLLAMTIRQHQISQDDLLYALVMWKFLGLYVIVRLSVRTDQQVRRCLWLIVAAASVVAVVAILQTLKLFGVAGLIRTYYAYSGTGPAATGARGSSTLGLPAATADLMLFNLAIVSGLWLRYRRHPVLLGAAAVLMVFGTLAAGETSGAIGLVVSVICIAIVTSSPRLLAVFIPAALVGSGVLRSVIGARINAFHTPGHVPASWAGRLSNLRTYFWPKLFSHWNFLLGVRPAARIPVPIQGAKYIWIESGYTWLLWGGGIPLLASYVFFVLAAARRGWMAARYGPGAASVAGAAAFVAVLVTAVLMLFDPHLTYRGSGDLLFVLIALAAPPRPHRGEPDTYAAPPHEAALYANRGSIVTSENDDARRGTPAAWLSRFPPDGNAPSPREPAAPRGGWDGGVPGVNPAAVRRGPRVPGQLPRFLRAHWASIVAITLAFIAGAGLLAGTQAREYKSQATVVVYPSGPLTGSTTQASVMGTEQAIALSNSVAAMASHRLHVPESALYHGLSVSAPANSYLLNVTSTGTDPRVAQRNAQAIADAYVAYRTLPQVAPSNRSPTATIPPVGSVDAAIVTPASGPGGPSSPNVALDIGVGLILGVVAGLGFALLRDRMDDRLRGPADLEAQSGAPVLGVVPAEPGGQHRDDGLAVLRSPGSRQADAFRDLRTRVIQAAARLDARTILVAGAAGEDDAAVSGNLAAALALAGRHVILVCADLRCSRTEDLFKVTGSPGLSAVLGGDGELAGAIQRTEVTGLEILPAGPVSAGQAVPQSPELPGVLNAIGRQADFVIIDAPPVMAGPDTGVLAELADMVLLVADTRRSTRACVRIAAREMEQLRNLPDGCVLVGTGSQRRLPNHPALPPVWSRLSGSGHELLHRHRDGGIPAPSAAAKTGPEREK